MTQASEGSTVRIIKGKAYLENVLGVESLLQSNSILSRIPTFVSEKVKQNITYFL